MTQLNKKDPYCGECGHNLTGLVDSSKCPECGRPIVEVLTRGIVWGKRTRSTTRLFGLPIIDIAFGPAPGEKLGHARGVFAFGDHATGLVAFGGRAIGLVAGGGVAMGGVTFGGVSLGIIGAWGGLAIGLFMATGGLACGLLSSGGLAIGGVAVGGMAVARYALGGATLGESPLSSTEAAEVFQQVSWFFGPMTGGYSLLLLVQPIAVLLMIAAVIATVLAILSALAHARRGNSEAAP